MRSVYELIKSISGLIDSSVWEQAELIPHATGQIVEKMVECHCETWDGPGFIAVVDRENGSLKSINIKKA